MANDAIQLQQQNAIMRRLLQQNSSKVLLPLPVERTTAGGIARVKLNNTGLLTRLFCEIVIPWSKPEAVAAVPHVFEMAEAVKRVRLLDYDGSSRIDLPLKLLLLINAMRKRGNLGNATYPISSRTDTPVTTSYGSSFREGGNGTGVSNIGTAKSGTLTMMVEIPVAADVEHGDLRGMMDLQFTSGEVYLNLEFANSLAGTSDAFAFDSAGVTLTMGSPEVHVWQEYYLPENVNGIRPLPMLDLSTVYELGSYLPTNDNISPGNEKRINLPPVREISGLAWTYLTDGAYAGAPVTDDITQLRILANGNNVLHDVSKRTHQWMTRRQLGYDLPNGTGVMDFADAPVSTAIFGNVQLAMTPGVSVVSPLLEVGFESIYAKNAALSGVPV